MERWSSFKILKTGVSQATELVKRREVIRILRPDKSSVKTFIKHFEFIRKFGGASGIVIQLPNDVTVDDVPPDSLIFLEREDDQPIMWDGTKAKYEEAEQGGDGDAEESV